MANGLGDPIFRSNPEPIDTLIADVHRGSLAIPDFQRSFVWEPARTVQLLGSIMSRYPAGTLLFLDLDPGHDLFEPREVEGAPTFNGTPQKLILDGQQRITSLYRARFGKGDDRFFVDLSKCIDADGDVITEPEQIEWDSATLAIDRAEWPEDEQDPENPNSRTWQLQHWCFPVDQIGVENALDDFLDDLATKLRPLSRSCAEFGIVTSGP
jgi:Protein of unknown function DUF262